MKDETQKTPHLLFVDDNLVDRMAFERFAKKESFTYDYTLAGSVKEAMDLLANVCFDIAVIDYSLGDGTAFDLFDSLSDIPTIVGTGLGDEELAGRAM